MLKNNRPFTNENGFIDAGLITDKDPEEMEEVFKWIHEKLIPRKTHLTGRSSYGIKHILERDTGIYLTNNEFKDAMLLCGYSPVDPNELNYFMLPILINAGFYSQPFHVSPPSGRALDTSAYTQPRA